MDCDGAAAPTESGRASAQVVDGVASGERAARGKRHITFAICLLVGTNLPFMDGVADRVVGGTHATLPIEAK